MEHEIGQKPNQESTHSLAAQGRGAEQPPSVVRRFMRSLSWPRPRHVILAIVMFFFILLCACALFLSPLGSSLAKTSSHSRRRTNSLGASLSSTSPSKPSRAHSQPSTPSGPEKDTLGSSSSSASKTSASQDLPKRSFWSRSFVSLVARPRVAIAIIAAILLVVTAAIILVVSVGVGTGHPAGSPSGSPGGSPGGTSPPPPPNVIPPPLSVGAIAGIAVGAVVFVGVALVIILACTGKLTAKGTGQVPKGSLKDGGNPIVRVKNSSNSSSHSDDTPIDPSTSYSFQGPSDDRSNTGKGEVGLVVPTPSSTQYKTGNTHKAPNQQPWEGYSPDDGSRHEDHSLDPQREGDNVVIEDSPKAAELPKEPIDDDYAPDDDLSGDSDDWTERLTATIDGVECKWKNYDDAAWQSADCIEGIKNNLKIIKAISLSTKFSKTKKEITVVVSDERGDEEAVGFYSNILGLYRAFAESESHKDDLLFFPISSVYMLLGIRLSSNQPNHPEERIMGFDSWRDYVNLKKKGHSDVSTKAQDKPKYYVQNLDDWLKTYKNFEGYIFNELTYLGHAISVHLLAKPKAGE